MASEVGVDLARLAPVLLASLAALFATVVAVLVLRGRLASWVTRSTPPTAPTSANKPNWGKRLGIVVAGLLVLAAAGVIAMVVIATQVGFYRERMRVKQVDLFNLGELDLTTFTPIAVESLAWVFTVMAVVLVLCNRSATRWTNSMWAFASIAAVVNAWNNWHQGDWLGGTVTGGLSLAGPYMVHMYVLFCRNMTHGKSIDETAADFTARMDRVVSAAAATVGHVADHVVHPVIAVRTVGIWRGHRGMSYDLAWLISSANYRAKIKRRALKLRARTGADQDAAAVTLPAVEGVTGEVPHRPETALAAPVSGGVLTAIYDENALLSDLRRVNSPADLIEAWEAETVRDTVNGSGQGGHADHAHRDSRPGHAADNGSVTRESRRDPVREPSRSRQKSRRESRRASRRDSGRVGQRESRSGQPSSHGRDPVAETTAETRHVDLIIARYYALLDADTDPAGVVKTRVAKDLGVDRGLLSKTFKECAEGVHPRPTEPKS